MDYKYSEDQPYESSSSAGPEYGSSSESQSQDSQSYYLSSTPSEVEEILYDSPESESDQS